MLRSGKAAKRAFGGFLSLFVLLASACAPLQSERLLTGAFEPRSVELEEVPFFPQEEFQCGPAALATVLRWGGVDVTPQQLTPQVYVPQRQGSFQLELVAATRRHEFVPYVLEPQLNALISEVAAGSPVLVLQNLGLSFIPTWHYAVVVGFDLDEANVVLRSGTQRRHTVSLRTFERTWRRAKHWAMVALPPGKLPRTAAELPYLQSVSALERLGKKQAAADAYAGALAHWPDSLPALLGLGNARHALNDLKGAAAAFREAVQRHPASAAAHNNLAQTLADMGRYAEAETLARRALELGANEPTAAIYRETLDEILKARGQRSSN